MFLTGSKLQKLCGSIFLIISIFSNQVSADIDHRKLKGIHDLLLPEYQYLSPFYGFNLLKKGTLENLYRYGIEDDKVVQLIQLMFYSVDHANFGVTRLPTHIASHLTTTSIGLILKELLRAQVIPENELKSNLLKAVDSALRLGIPNQYKAKQRQILRKQNKNFINTLVAAFGETLGPQRKYPAHFVEHILLGLFWAKAKNDKHEILHLFGEFPHALTFDAIEMLLTPNQQARWVEDNYTFDDYAQIEKNLKNPEIPTEEFLSEPERTSFFAYSDQVWDAILPPIFNFDQALVSLPDGTIESFADCGETSIRNFFNIVLRNPKTHTFDISFIKNNSIGKNLKISDDLLEFYEKNFNLSNLGTIDLHNQWARVVSNLDEVSYKQPKPNPVCNITGGLKSVLKVFEKLLFSVNSNFGQLNPVEQFDLLVEYFSRPDFRLSWDLQAAPRNDLLRFNVGVTVQFSINGTAAFSWDFLPGHFTLSSDSKVASDQKDGFSRILAHHIKLNSESATSQHSESLNTLSWFSFSHNLNSQLIELKSAGVLDPDLQLLFWSVPLKSNFAKLEAISVIVENKWEGLYPLVKKLVKKMPLDVETHSNIINFALTQSSKGFNDLLEDYLERLSLDSDLRGDALRHCIVESLNAPLSAILKRFEFAI
jgi:hypothetical protein